MLYMIDTDISSYIIRQHSRDVEARYAALRGNQDNKFYLSAVTYAELIIGIKKKPSWAPLVSEYLTGITVMDWTKDAAAHYGEIVFDMRRNGRVIDIHDMQIAAHARSLGATIVTNNIKHFECVPGVLIENWAGG